MLIHKDDITAALRARGQDDRADWVQRTLPDQVDAARNDGLLKLLDLDLTTMRPIEEPAKS
ncbi:hypothetical protein DFJ67_0563 [Asanoa ferruginea]|uniref:Uncharacterized protein n=1 Tax=Asanoa ferruginea TaxID=53367 RepID=A0A3D9ZFK9_9ACTN|nr:hypothetical protein [Asanoa ferruginea]REF94623.1 hypothetical protein DFJ67_0563 [Asanoa ferruginea]GIF50814.1 hypothetical protein Afe04nite_53530 [Asanoa ferruginea]